jgi:ribulose-5-phosphate 4-epimerase/fuculose-1-phosphate aldolase
MSEASTLREDICVLGKSLFDRGLTCGSSGNISARLSDGSILVTPTGRALGFLDPAQISHLDADFTHLSGDAPTKETPLHSAFYETRTGTGAVVHLHSTHSVAMSMLPDTDPDNVLPPLTPIRSCGWGR